VQKVSLGVEVLSEGGAGTFRSSLSANRAVGTDVQANVNGTAATGKGNKITLNTATLSFSLNVAEGSNSTIGFTITGGGASSNSVLTLLATSKLAWVSEA
jgi:flagellin